MIDDAISWARAAGQVLLGHFGRTTSTLQKSDLSNVVTAADLESEQAIVRAIRHRHPTHSIIAEETGCDLRGSEFTWVIDPLDGTSNFAAGIPWFGVLIALLRAGEPQLGVLHLPVSDELYCAERGGGAYRNGRRISVTAEPLLSNVLWAWGMDAAENEAAALRDTALLARVLQRVRNVRATNSLVDCAYVADGRLGGMVNRSTRIWDIAASMVIIGEAGGVYTQADGNPLTLDATSRAAERVYAVMAGAPTLHRQMLALVGAPSGAGLPSVSADVPIR
jgi:myo-inositol-1(or 4)-monophosphatase